VRRAWAYPPSASNYMAVAGPSENVYRGSATWAMSSAFSHLYHERDEIKGPDSYGLNCWHGQARRAGPRLLRL